MVWADCSDASCANSAISIFIFSISIGSRVAIGFGGDHVANGVGCVGDHVGDGFGVVVDTLDAICWRHGESCFEETESLFCWSCFNIFSFDVNAFKAANPPDGEWDFFKLSACIWAGIGPAVLTCVGKMSSRLIVFCGKHKLAFPAHPALHLQEARLLPKLTPSHANRGLHFRHGSKNTKCHFVTKTAKRSKSKQRSFEH